MDEDAALAALFNTATQPEQHSTPPPTAQLVTVVITIHDNALQQALLQAQGNLHCAEAQAARLQAEADALRAQLQQAAPRPPSVQAGQSHDVHQVLQQLRAAQQRANAVAAEHAAAVQTVSGLQRQLSEQGGSLADTQGANQTLRRELQAAQATAAEASGTVELVRYGERRSAADVL